MLKGSNGVGRNARRLTGTRYLLLSPLSHTGKLDGAGDIIIDMVGITWWLNGKKTALSSGLHVQDRPRLRTHSGDLHNIVDIPSV